ncbi:MAG: LysR family transcriptional regulator [Methylotenera sp.]|nr:LysR family transcriptional regulator [Oligoflexia bacterium]
MRKTGAESGIRYKGSQINWNQVYYFSEIASFGSIKEAADKLELSPSTLSVHLTQLEKSLELQLFYRQHRKLVLTPEGNRLYAHAKEMFEAGQRLIDVVSPVPLGSYPVSVGLVASPSIETAYQLLGDYLGKHEHLNMKLFHSGYARLEEGLATAQFDFGFSDRIPERRDLVCIQVSNVPIKFFVSRKWEGHRFSEVLSKLPLLICNAEPAHRSFAEQALIEADLTPSSVVTSDYPSALLSLCERGLGVGVFSEAEGLKSLRIPKDAPKLQDNLYVLWSREAENTAAVKQIKAMVLK